VTNAPVQLTANWNCSTWHTALGAAVALGVHLGALLVALQCEGLSQVAPLVITEVDLTPVEPKPPEPQPPPLVEPPAQPAAQAPKVHVRPVRREPSSAPPPPAAAGALHVAHDDAPTDSEPVRFAVDATGAGYGFGVVAAGGSGGQRGGTGTSTPQTPNQGSAAAPGDGSALRRFAVPPRLDESDPCRGFFPTAASVDRGEVTLRLVVSNQGRVERASVLVEEPAGQGFGRSAVLCLRQKRFSPALDENGFPQAAEAPVAVRFSR